MGLFNLTPQQVRDSARMQNRQQASQFGGWGMLGNFIGEKIGTKPRMQGTVDYQSKIMSIKQNVISQPGFKALKPAQKISALSNAYINAGEVDLATQLMQVAGGGVNSELLKETRKASRTSVETANTNARSMRADYKKLKNLSKMAKGKGTSARAARNSMIANIVRLNSPGIVQEKELQIYTGGQGTTAAMLAWMSGKGYDTNAIMSYMDPSGETFDADGMLELGGILVLGKAQPVFDQIEDARTRATNAGVSERGMKSIFSGTSNIDALTSLREEITSAKGSIPEGVDPEDWKYMTPEEKALF